MDAADVLRLRAAEIRREARSITPRLILACGEKLRDLRASGSSGDRIADAAADNVAQGLTPQVNFVVGLLSEEQRNNHFNDRVSSDVLAELGHRSVQVREVVFHGSPALPESQPSVTEDGSA